MMDILDLLTIHKYDINTTLEKIRDTFNELGLDIERLEERTMENLIGEPIQEDLGNQIIAAMLNAAKSMLLEKTAPYKPEVEIYCNGMDSRFWVPEEHIRIIRTANDFGLEYDLVLWLWENAPDNEDFSFFAETDAYHPALQKMMETNVELTWGNLEDLDIPEEEAKIKENAFLAAPDANRPFLFGPSGKYYTASVS